MGKLQQGDTSVNLQLAAKYGKTEEEVMEIDRLHKERENIFKMLSDGSIKPTKRISKVLEQIEESLQIIWFKKYDPNYYAFWKTPKCSCPELDNQERYPYGHYTVVSDCPLHGAYVKTKS